MNKKPMIGCSRGSDTVFGVMFFVTIIVAIIVGGIMFVSAGKDKDVPTPDSPQSRDASAAEDKLYSDAATVIKVSDGDTVTATIGDETVKVRLIGVDTPESVSPDESRNVPFGKVAAKFTSGQLLGKDVILKTDVSEYDKYGRLLAYVYLPDGTFYNELLVREGYARVMTVPPNIAHAEDFLAAEKAAREDGLGIWQDYDNIFPQE